MSATTLKRVQYSTEVIAWQINPADLGDAEVVHYSIPALQETGRPAIEPANEIASNKWSLRGGEVLVSKLNVHKNCVAIVERHDDLPLVSSTEFVPFVPTGIEPRYLKYVFQSEETIQHLMSFSESATRSHARVNPSDIIKLKVHQPDLGIQVSIANYLDRETARIDGLIAEKERMLALLEEKRAALISRVVTRGLDPDAPLKPSGQEWLGEIPAHWRVERLKFHLLNIEQGRSPQCDNYPAELGEWGVLKVGAVNDWKFNPQENKRLPDEVEPLCEYEIKPRDVLMSRANTTQLLGSVVYVREISSKLLLCDKIYRLNINDDELDREFLVAFLRASPGRYQLERDASGTSGSMQNIGQDTVQNTWIVVPPLAEQKAIVQHLTSCRNKIEKMNESLRETTNLLRERRAALITAAVTGQTAIEDMN